MVEKRIPDRRTGHQKSGLPLRSLAIVESMDPAAGTVKFREQD